MILVVGLGNPGTRYANTRHNLGFVVADELAAKSGPAVWRKKFSGDFAEAELFGDRVLLLKPGTYMNESGRSVRAAAVFYKIEPRAVLVVHDELDLPFGVVRLKIGGGEAGHNGVRSVSEHLGTRDYARLRLGVGKPPAGYWGDGADFVLEAFAPAEKAELGKFVEQASNAVELVVGKGLEHAMNVTNRRAS